MTDLEKLRLFRNEPEHWVVQRASRLGRERLAKACKCHVRPGASRVSLLALHYAGALS